MSIPTAKESAATVAISPNSPLLVYGLSPKRTRKVSKTKAKERELVLISKTKAKERELVLIFKAKKTISKG